MKAPRGVVKYTVGCSNEKHAQTSAGRGRPTESHEARSTHSRSDCVYTANRQDGDAHLEYHPVHTGSQHVVQMSDIFFQELDFPEPTRIAAGGHGRVPKHRIPVSRRFPCSTQHAKDAGRIWDYTGSISPLWDGNTAARIIDCPLEATRGKLPRSNT